MIEIREKSYIRLLLGLLVFLLVNPLAEQYLHGFAALAVDVTILAPIVIGVWNLKRGTRWFGRGLVLMGLILAVQAANVVSGERLLEPVVHVLSIAFFAGMGLIALEDVLFGGEIDGNRLIGAVCVYLLFGIAWGILYALVNAMPGTTAFANLVPLAAGGSMNDYVYYSFVTLTTLGYGDVTPVTAPARTFAALEAVTGQLYMAVLVARLVGLHIANRPAGPDKRAAEPPGDRGV